MDVKEAIEKRRAYRAIKGIEISDRIIQKLIRAAQLAPSCFNKQPWRYVFAYEKDLLKELYSAMSKGNEWVFNSSMIIAVYSNIDMDCRIKGRDYYLFDSGISAGFLILQATELGLVAHPIAGYDESRVKKILQIPEKETVIALVIVGRHEIDELGNLSEKNRETELKRPDRLPAEEILSTGRLKAE